MVDPQTLVFALFLVLFGLLVWGRLRYDLVAFGGLVVAAALGLVPGDEMFSGFGHSAVAIIALVLIVSRGLSASGAVELIAAPLVSAERPLPWHIAAITSMAAALSTVINNVAALALLMPLDIEAAKKAGRPTGRSLMPLTFATILGGMVTLIGTPPNIVISEFRADILGEPYRMFDFTPVGLAVTVAGILFMSLAGWRLLPARDAQEDLRGDIAQGRYVAELRVAEQDPEKPVTVRNLYPQAADADVNIVGLIRRGGRLPGLAGRETLAQGDFLVVEGEPRAIEAFMGKAALDFAGSERHEGGVTSTGLTLAEAIVPVGARIENRSAYGLHLLAKHSVTLLGVAREGRRFRDRVGMLDIRAGDVLLLLGTPERVTAAIDWLGVLPIEGRHTEVVQRHKAGAAIGIFGLAIVLAALGVVALGVALGLAVVGFVALGLVNGRNVYNAVEWKVIVLLASLIPLAEAFERTGGADLLAQRIVGLTQGYPAWVGLAVLMAVTMTLSDFLNNVATALIAAPIALSLAAATSSNPDAYLMGVAISASCAFLTPIGDENNTIILGPGGYRFGDFWRLGLPLKLVVIAVGVPMLMLVWPL